MKKNWVLLICFFCFEKVTSQELNCTVTLNYDRVTNVNTQIFKTLETQITEFMNNTKWTTKEFTKTERIECSLFLNISGFNSNDFSATLQVQSSRPIFNTTYSSRILNINDVNVNFRYIENEIFFYDPNNYTSNLVSILAFYANIIIGLDADSFQELGGANYLEKASGIMNLAQSSGYGGWDQNDPKNQNRYFLISDLLSNTFSPFRKSLYQFHLKGLDVMADNPSKGKQQVYEAIQTVAQIHKLRPNALLTRIFFDAKADEIVSIFSGGPMMQVSDLIQILNQISPLNSSKWNTIR